MALTEAQQEAAELATAVIDFAHGKGWDVAKKGVNQSYAWVHLTHPLHEQLQLFYSVDPDSRDDKFVYEAEVVPLEALKPIITAASTADLIDIVDADGAEWGRSLARVLNKPTNAGGGPVPPTSAAHSAAHPAPVPPTVDEAADAAHQRASAAHTPDAVPPIAGSAAHLVGDNFDVPPTAWAEKRAAHQAKGVPPTEDDMSPDELDREDLMEARQEAKKHLEQAGQPASQLDTIAAVEAQYVTKRNWSGVASPLTNDELLVQVLGRTLTFRNRQSGRLEQATVCTSKEAKRYTPKITPEGFDAESVGEDLRILHFLELGAGFRSVAVSQITEIN